MGGERGYMNGCMDGDGGYVNDCGCMGGERGYMNDCGCMGGEGGYMNDCKQCFIGFWPSHNTSLSIFITGHT